MFAVPCFQIFILTAVNANETCFVGQKAFNWQRSHASSRSQVSSQTSGSEEGKLI